MRLDEMRIKRGFREGRVADQGLQEEQVGIDAGDARVGECIGQREPGAFAVLAPGDKLGDHRVVERRDLVPRLDAAVDTQARPALGKGEMGEAPRLRQEAPRRVLGIEPRLDGMAGGGDVFLREGQRLSRRDAKLPFHQVEPGHHLGHRVLDLEAGVHLDEVEGAALVDQEFHRARAGIADRAREPDGGFAHLRAQRIGQAGRRRLLDHLLVPALDRAVAVEQVQHRAVRIGQHLHLHMARPGDIALQQQRAVAEGRGGFALRGRERPGQVLRAPDDAHAAPAAAGRGLDEHRIADLRRRVRQPLGRCVGFVIARHERHLRVGCDLLRGALGAHRPDRVRRRADEGEAGCGDALGEPGVLGEEPVARMHRLRAGAPRRVDQRVDVEIARLRARRADAHALVRLADMGRAGVRLGMDGDDMQPHAPGGPGDAAGDLAAIGDQQPPEHDATIPRKRPRSTPPP